MKVIKGPGYCLGIPTVIVWDLLHGVQVREEFSYKGCNLGGSLLRLINRLGLILIICNPNYA